MNQGLIASLSFIVLDAKSKVKNEPSKELINLNKLLKENLKQYFQSFSFSSDFPLGKMGESILIEMVDLLLKASKQEELQFYAVSLIGMLHGLKGHSQDFLGIQATTQQIHQELNDFEKKPVSSFEFHTSIKLATDTFVARAEKLKEDFDKYLPRNYHLVINKLDKLVTLMKEIEKLAAETEEKEINLVINDGLIQETIRKKIEEFSQIARIHAGDTYLETKGPIKIITAEDCRNLISKIVAQRSLDLPTVETTPKEVCDLMQAILSGVTPIGEISDIAQTIITSQSSVVSAVQLGNSIDEAAQKKKLTQFYLLLAAKIGAAATLGVLACFFPPVAAAIPFILTGVSATNCLASAGGYLREIILSDSEYLDCFINLVETFDKCIHAEMSARLIQREYAHDVGKEIDNLLRVQAKENVIKELMNMLLEEKESEKSMNTEDEEKEEKIAQVPKKVDGIHKKETLQTMKGLFGGVESPATREIKLLKVQLKESKVAQDKAIHEFLTSPKEYKRTYEITQALCELNPKVGEAAEILRDLFKLPAISKDIMQNLLESVLGNKVDKDVIEQFARNTCEFLDSFRNSLQSDLSCRSRVFVQSHQRQSFNVSQNISLAEKLSIPYYVWVDPSM